MEIEEGKPLKVVGTMQDITELKLIEQDRNKYLSNFEDTLNTINDAFFALNSNLEITRINESFSKLTGKDNSIIGQHFLNVFGGSVNVNFYTAYQRAVKEKQISKLEDFSNYLQKWISMKVYPTDEGAAVYFSDTTEIRLKDMQLKEAVERYDLVARATQDVIYDFDMVHDRLIYNTSLTQLIKLPYNKIEYHLDWWRSLIHPDDLPRVISSQNKVIREKRTNWECEYRVDSGNGVYKYIMDQGYFIFNDDHEPVRLIGAIRDIDTLKRTHEENSRLAGIITRVNNMIVVTDQHGQVTWVNRAFENIVGYKLEEIEGKKPREFFNGPETNLNAVEEIKQRKRKRETFAIDLVNHGKAGQPIWVTAEFTPMYDEGRYLGYIAVYTDISVKKAQEREIKYQNNMLRGVAWMASHELRRPVATILGLLYLIKLAEDDKEKEELVALIDKCANELDEIVHQMNGKIYADGTYHHDN
jgi:PAS domain S-box-containing protein